MTYCQDADMSLLQCMLNCSLFLCRSLPSQKPLCSHKLTQPGTVVPHLFDTVCDACFAFPPAVPLATGFGAGGDPPSARSKFWYAVTSSRLLAAVTTCRSSVVSQPFLSSSVRHSYCGVCHSCSTCRFVLMTLLRPAAQHTHMPKMFLPKVLHDSGNEIGRV